MKPIVRSRSTVYDRVAANPDTSVGFIGDSLRAIRVRGGRVPGFAPCFPAGPRIPPPRARGDPGLG
ncbi:MAG: hypothetical protein AMXMBFR42_24530 [Burkholderiales bacterium]